MNNKDKLKLLNNQIDEAITSREDLKGKISNLENSIINLQRHKARLRNKLGMPVKTFRLSYKLDVDLTEDDIWPDGDVPANPTVDDVYQVVEEAGGFVEIINDWNLVDLDEEEKVFTIKEVKSKKK